MAFEDAVPWGLWEAATASNVSHTENSLFVFVTAVAVAFSMTSRS